MIPPLENVENPGSSAPRASFLRVCASRSRSPTPVNVAVATVDRMAAKPIYREALLVALRCVQDHIPGGDLAVQWHLIREFAVWKGSLDTSLAYPSHGGTVATCLETCCRVDRSRCFLVGRHVSHISVSLSVAMTPCLKMGTPRDDTALLFVELSVVRISYR